MEQEQDMMYGTREEQGQLLQQVCSILKYNIINVYLYH